MNGLRLSRVVTLALAFILMASLLAACGGDDDGGSNDPPVPGGADEIGEQDMSADEFGESDVDLAEGKTVAYRVSDSSLDEVSTFYESDVEDDGWTVVNHINIEGLMFAVLSKDMTIVVASAMTGATAKESAEQFDLGELGIEDDDLADDDILVVVGDVACEEDDLATCVTALDVGF